MEKAISCGGQGDHHWLHCAIPAIRAAEETGSTGYGRVRREVVVITGLVAEVVYSVSVQVATTGGMSTSDDIIVPTGEADRLV